MTSPNDGPAFSEPTFSALGLLPAVQSAVDSKGYSVPTPIQAQTIPFLLEGRDVLGQASTGTGKTAAFALPLLSKIDVSRAVPQVLVLAPTRELAIQVAGSFSAYGDQMPGLNVQAIYGGASYYHQLKELRRGVHVIVGTPGRIMDHMRRGTLSLESLRCLILDEADEMLRMGFVEDVRWILEQSPAERQTALFSATMPDAIRRIAQEYLRNPATVTIKSDSSVAPTIRTRFLMVSPREKTDALIRILETEEADGVIVFVKTRETTVRLADELADHGFSAIAINGDMEQKQREHTIEQLRSGRLDVLVATDVAARGLDVQRISHVINFDPPHDAESWVHRIGRTGRAGRTGEAILFLGRHERRYLKILERGTRQGIAEMELPGPGAVNARRKTEFKKQVLEAVGGTNHEIFCGLLKELQQESGRSADEIGAAVAVVLFGDRPFLLPEPTRPPRPERQGFRHAADDQGRFQDRPGRRDHRQHPEAGPGRKPQPPKRGRKDDKAAPFVPGAVPVEASSFEHRAGQSSDRDRRARRGPEAGMETFRVEVGLEHGVRPSNLVGAIANEAGLDSKNIGRIEIRDNHSFVDLPEGMPKEIFRGLKDVVVLGRHLRITRIRAERGRFRRPPGGGHDEGHRAKPRHSHPDRRRKSAE